MRFATLADGAHVLVGKDIDTLDEFVEKIITALALGLVLIFVLAGVAIVVLPMLVLYILLARRIITGLTLGAGK